MDNIIRIASKVQDLKGIGTEYLVIDGVIIARFYNGNFDHAVTIAVNSDDVTLKAA